MHQDLVEEGKEFTCFALHFLSTTVAARITHVPKEKQTESQQLPELLFVAEKPHACMLTCQLGNEHVSTAPPPIDMHQQQRSIDLDAMDAVFHEVVMRRLHSPMGYKSLGKDRPPLVVHHSSFSDYVKSMRVVG